MNRLIISILITVCLAIAIPSLHAQQVSQGITITNVSPVINGENLDLGFTVQASALQLNCDGQLKLEFAVETDSRRLVLPVVIYSGTQRYIYEQRRAELSGAYRVEPYKVYKGVNKRDTYTLDYTLSLPYYAWMEHASITYREYTHDCSGDHLTDNGILVVDLNPVPEYVTGGLGTQPRLVC